MVTQWRRERSWGALDVGSGLGILTACVFLTACGDTTGMPTANVDEPMPDAGGGLVAGQGPGPDVSSEPAKDAGTTKDAAVLTTPPFPQDSGAGAGAGGSGTDAGTIPLDAGSTTDAAMVDAGSTPAIDAGPVGMSGGVLTNHPNLTFLNAGSGITITSAYLEMIEGATLITIRLYAELENMSSDTLCIPLVDVLTVGGVDVLGVVEAPPYDVLSTLSSPCLPPGGTGVMRGIENDVPASLLDTATSFNYAISGLVRNDAFPHLADPTILSADAVLDSPGTYVVSGQLRTTSMAIYNLKLLFFAVDPRGLIVDDTDAFPLSLGTLPVNSTIDYTTYPFFWYEQEPTSLFGYNSFILSSSSAFVLLGSDGPRLETLEAQREELERRRTELRGVAR